MTKEKPVPRPSSSNSAQAASWTTAKLTSVQSENKRLGREVTRLKQELAKAQVALREATKPAIPKIVENNTADVETQCTLGFVSNCIQLDRTVQRGGSALHRKREGNRETHVSGRMESGWLEYGGGDLEPMLASEGVRLLSASWLIEAGEAGQKMTWRYQLPEEAFFSLPQLKAAGCAYELLPIIVVSCPWLTPHHPDPRGFHFQRIVRVLRALTSNGQRYGVFWDLGSLLYNGAGEYSRSKEEEEAYQEAVRNMGLLYGHPSTLVIRQTLLPKGWMEEYDLPNTANLAEYNRRSWCFLEMTFATLAKSAELSLDVGKLPLNMDDQDEPTDRKGLLRLCGEGKFRPPPL
jgi:hypothetical protein